MAREVPHGLTPLRGTPWHRCAALCTPASSRARVPSPPGGPQPGRDLVGWLDVFIGCAPGAEGSGHAAAGHRDPEVGDA
jgi:hypothetical protein